MPETQTVSGEIADIIYKGTGLTISEIDRMDLDEIEAARLKVSGVKLQWPSGKPLLDTGDVFFDTGRYHLPEEHERRLAELMEKYSPHKSLWTKIVEYLRN